MAELINSRLQIPHSGVGLHCKFLPRKRTDQQTQLEARKSRFIQTMDREFIYRCLRIFGIEPLIVKEIYMGLVYMWRDFFTWPDSQHPVYKFSIHSLQFVLIALSVISWVIIAGSFRRNAVIHNGIVRLLEERDLAYLRGKRDILEQLATVRQEGKHDIDNVLKFYCWRHCVPAKLFLKNEDIGIVMARILEAEKRETGYYGGWLNWILDGNIGLFYASNYKFPGFVGREVVVDNRSTPPVLQTSLTGYTKKYVKNYR